MVFYPSSGEHCDIDNWDSVEAHRYDAAGELTGSRLYEQGHHQELLLEAGIVLGFARRLSLNEEVEVRFDELTPVASRRHLAALGCARAIHNDLCPLFMFVPHESAQGTIQRRVGLRPDGT